MDKQTPEAPATVFHHHLPVQIRFNDVDMLGHLNNSVYFTFMDLAKTRYFQAVMGPDIQFRNFGLVIVNVNCDFCQQSFFDDELMVETAVISIGQKSLRLEQRVYGVEKHDIRCRCTTVMCGFDPRTGQSAPIAPEWREGFEKFEQRSF